MQYYVDILSGTTKVGSGPLIAIQDWTVTRRIDRAGTFSFTVPAGSDTGDIVVAKRTANIYLHLASGYTYVGGGIIDRIERIVNADGSVTLRVSGDDDMRELTYRSVHALVTQVTDDANDWIINATLGTSTGVNGLAYANGVVVAANNNGYVHRTDDDGATWDNVTRLGTSNNVLRVYYDTFKAAFYASDSTNNATYTGGLYGASWSVAGGFSNFAFDAAPCRWGSQTIWLMSTPVASNIYRRSNAGGWSSTLATWTDEGAMGSATRTECIIWVSATVAVAGCNDGHIYRSTDSGSSWSDEGQLGSSTNVAALATDGAGVVLAGCNDGHIYRSTDSGANWSDIGQLGSEGRVRCIAQTSTDTWIAGTSFSAQIFRSEDNGASWSLVADLGSETDVLSLVSTGDGFAYAGTGGNVYKGEPAITAATHAEAVQLLEDLSPSWTFTADPDKTSNAVFIQFAGETLLAAALLVANRSQSHCYLSGARALTFASAWTSSGVHAIAPQLGSAMDTTTAALLEMVITSETYDIVTRVYPYGKTSTGVRLGIGTSTISAPTGTTVDTTANYVQHTDGYTTYGRIERWVTFDDIVASTTDTRVAADALVKNAALYLSKTTTPITNYRVTLGGCATLLSPMQTLRITYVADGLTIDTSLNILETTWRGDAAGIATVGAVVSDGTYWILDDAETISAAMSRVDRLAAQ